MFGGFGVWEVLLILALFLLLFGGRKIPEVARGLGEAIRNFKGSVKEGEAGEDETPELPRSGEPGER